MQMLKSFQLQQKLQQQRQNMVGGGGFQQSPMSPVQVPSQQPRPSQPRPPMPAQQQQQPQQPPPQQQPMMDAPASPGMHGYIYMRICICIFTGCCSCSTAFSFYTSPTGCSQIPDPCIQAHFQEHAITTTYSTSSATTFSHN